MQPTETQQTNRTPGEEAIDQAITQRARELFNVRFKTSAVQIDRMFAMLILCEWVAAIALSYWISPFAWAGRESVIHSHVFAAVLVGGAISSLPIALAYLQPGRLSTRCVIACAQMLWSALLIHLSGGRIETHFHIFGSLAFIAFYCDARLLIPATIVVSLDHFIRGLYWPESIYGVANPEWWRFLEHAGWVVFIDIFLLLNCLRGRRELSDLSRQQAQLEESHDKLMRIEKLAAVGQLAASVGHELRNPLAAIGNAHTYITKRMAKANGQPLQDDEKVKQFLGIMRRELDASAGIITNLLDFSRMRQPAKDPCPLHPLMQESIDLVPNAEHVQIINEISEQLPIPHLDKDQCRQVFVNLIQNAVEAMSGLEGSKVVISAEGGDSSPWRITVRDNGPGMPPEVAAKIFQPLFSTKTKGTGLGLAVVAGIVEKHGGTLVVQSNPGEGAAFVTEIPPNGT